MRSYCKVFQSLPLGAGSVRYLIGDPYNRPDQTTEFQGPFALELPHKAGLIALHNFLDQFATFVPTNTGPIYSGPNVAVSWNDDTGLAFGPSWPQDQFRVEIDGIWRIAPYKGHPYN